MIEPISPVELQARLGLEPDADGLPRWSGVTKVLRQALARWGLSRPGTLGRHLRYTLDACGYAGVTERVRESLELLCVLGDAELVWADAPPPAPPRDDAAEGAADAEVGALPSLLVSGRLVAPTLPRAVRLGERYLVLGTREVERVEIERWGPPEAPRSAARWLHAAAEDALESGGFEVISPDRWLGPSSLLDHLERREARGQLIEDLWPALVRALDEGGGPIDDPSRVRLLGGEPGGFWGRAATGDGRWRSVDRAPSGELLGVILGHFGERTQPIIARIEGGVVQRVLELYDHEELRWAVLSRGACTGAPERARLRDGALRLSCPLPAEALRPRAICAVDAWAWAPPPFVDLPPFAGAVATRFALALE